MLEWFNELIVKLSRTSTRPAMQIVDNTILLYVYVNKRVSTLVRSTRENQKNTLKLAAGHAGIKPLIGPVPRTSHKI